MKIYTVLTIESLGENPLVRNFTSLLQAREYLQERFDDFCLVGDPSPDEVSRPHPLDDSLGEAEDAMGRIDEWWIGDQGEGFLIANEVQ